MQPHDVHEQPKAYCLLASAEARRYGATREPDALRSAIAAADWLVNHADIDGDGMIGWGLPFAWDAGGDGSENPPDTEYAVQTALAIQALLDVCDVLHSADNQPQRLQYIGVATGAALTYALPLALPTNAGSALQYSSEPHDAYHVLNVGALMAGQVQRLSGYVAGNLALALREFADHQIQYIISRTQYAGRTPYWLYYGDVMPHGRSSNKPNDLQHESYIAQGLLDYVRYDGQFATAIDLSALLFDLKRFSHGGTIALVPRTDEYTGAAVRWADVWRVGYALRVACALEEELAVAPTLSRELAQALYERYRASNGSWYRAPDNRQLCSFPRQVAFVLLGLAWYEYSSAAAG